MQSDIVSKKYYRQPPGACIRIRNETYLGFDMPKNMKLMSWLQWAIK